MPMLNWTSWCKHLYTLAQRRGLSIKSLVEKEFCKHSKDFGWFKVQGHKLGGHGGYEAVYNRVMQTLLPDLLIILSDVNRFDLIREINAWIESQSSYFSREVSGAVLEPNMLFNHYF